MTPIQLLRKKIDQYLNDLSHAKKRVVEEKEKLNNTKTKLDNATKAQEILQTIAQGVQQKAHERIATVVTKCLKAVFGEDSYDFVIRFEQKRGKTEADLKLTKGELEVDPLEAAGGGVCDVASFALRLAALVLSRPRKRRVLIIDEGFRFVSKEYRPKVREMLEQVTSELGVQVILVTHDPGLQMGNVVEIE